MTAQCYFLVAEQEKEVGLGGGAECLTPEAKAALPLRTLSRRALFQLRRLFPAGFLPHYDETWNDFIGDSKMLEQAKTYVYVKVKLVFDPPASSSAIAALERTADEALWRLST